MYDLSIFWGLAVNMKIENLNIRFTSIPWSPTHMMYLNIVSHRYQKVDLKTGRTPKNIPSLHLMWNKSDQL